MVPSWQLLAQNQRDSGKVFLRAGAVMQAKRSILWTRCAGCRVNNPDIVPDSGDRS